MSDDLGNTDVTPRWKSAASVGGIGRPKRRRALNVSSERKQEIRAAKCRHCRLCDSTERVQAHHLVPRGMGGTIGGEWTESNIVGLCPDCHKMIERRFRPACHLLRAMLTDAEYSYVSSKMGEDWLDRRYPAIWDPAASAVREQPLLTADPGLPLTKDSSDSKVTGEGNTAGGYVGPVAQEITFDAQRDPMFQDEQGNGWVPYARFCEVDDERGRLRERDEEQKEILRRTFVRENEQKRRADEAEKREGRLREQLEAREKLLADAAKPLSRLKLTHSAACPFMFDGDCACGVESIEVLARAALGVEGPAG